jgi:hypothetical protein
MRQRPACINALLVAAAGSHLLGLLPPTPSVLNTDSHSGCVITWMTPCTQGEPAKLPSAAPLLLLLLLLPPPVPSTLLLSLALAGGRCTMVANAGSPKGRPIMPKLST